MIKNTEWFRISSTFVRYGQCKPRGTTPLRWTRSAHWLVPVIALLVNTPVAATTFEQCGRASWYDLTSMTASGERANPRKLTAAHKTLPFGTMVQVSNLSNGRVVTVRINDRGPFVRGRVIDVTKAAAAKLGFVSNGVARVRIKVLSKPKHVKPAASYLCAS